MDNHISGEYRDIETQVTIKRPHEYRVISSDESWINDQGEFQSGDCTFFMTEKNFKNMVYIGRED